MTSLLLTARDPLTAGDGAHAVRTAAALARAGEPTTLVLLEDGVTIARLGHRAVEEIVDALDAGVEVLVERDACARRGVDPIDGIKAITFAEIVDRLDTDRSLWL